MSKPPVTPEQLAALPPEFRALLQAVIDHYEARIVELERQVGRTRKTLRCHPARSIRMPNPRRPSRNQKKHAAANQVIPSVSQRLKTSHLSALQNQPAFEV